MPTRTPSTLLRRAVAWLVLVVLQLAPPGVALAGPAGEQVVHGQADFQRDGDLTVITTHTLQTIVHYSSFDIGVPETVLIHQPDAGSRILNQVLSTDPTFIDGSLLSNGQVWIANPVGVFFGDQAIVDVGRLVAAAGEVTDADFLAGVERFGALAGRVEVAAGAEIRAADSVLLVGEHVANYGNITASDGMIALVAGGEVRLARVGGRVSITADAATAPDPERWGVVQAGSLDARADRVHLTAGDAYSLAMNHSGITRAREIHVRGGDGGLVEVAGRLDATGDPGAGGGRIAVLGDLVSLRGQLDASGDTGGGEILVGGERSGQGDTPTASRTLVSGEAVLRADALETGDGGRIIVWADDATAFYGSLSARGAGAGGDGGFAEISGRRSLVSRGAIDLGAEAGEFGTLLYDPLRILIQGGVGDGTDTDVPVPPEDFLTGDGGTAGHVAATDTGEGAEPFVIFESELEGTQANLVLEASQRIETQGAFVDDDVVIAPGRDLRMQVVDGGDALVGGDAGIDLTAHGGDLTWVLSDGGSFVLSTESTADRDASIRVGAIETQGVRAGTNASVLLAVEGRGDIDVDSIDTSGVDRSGDVEIDVFGVAVNTLDAGNVTLTTQTGSIDVGSVRAVGGNATALPDGAGDGGEGGEVVLTAVEGSLTVGSVDVSGGDGVVQLVVDPELGTLAEGRGGNAGNIGLVADLDPTAADPAEPAPDPRVVRVTGDLLARGGRGLGSELDAGESFGAAGGTGGQILISAGLTADEGRVELGSGAEPILLDVSGGDGTAAGGNAGSGGQSAFSSAALGAIRIEAHGDVTLDAELVARGGEAGIEAAVPTGPGGLGGLGGDVSLGSDTGDVTLHGVGASPVVVTDGGAGRIDASTVLDEDGVARFDGAGGSAGALTVEVAGDGSAISVEGAVRALGADGDEGAGGAGGNVTIVALDGAITLDDVDVSGGDGSGSVSVADGALEAQGVTGGNGGNVIATGQAGSGDTAVGGGDLLLGGSIVSLGGTGEADPLDPPDPEQDPRENHGLAGSVQLRSVGNLDAAPGAVAPRIQAGTIALEAEDLFAGGGPDLLLASADASGPEAFVDRAIVEARGDLRVLLDDAARFDRLELIQRDAAGSVDVLRDDAATVVARGSGGVPDDSVHTIEELTTGGLDPHVTYRLADSVLTTDAEGELTVEEVDVRSLAVAAGAVDLGIRGGKLANAREDGVEPEGERLLGGVIGVGGGPHVTTAGNLELVGSSVGAGATLAVEGAPAGGPAPATEVTVGGDLDLAVSGAMAIVDVVQRSAAGDATLVLPGGGSVVMEGSIIDTGASRLEASRVTGVDTTGSDTAFFFHLADDSLSSDEVTSGEPVLTIASGAVTLGADAGFAARGDVVLEGGAGPAVDAGGHRVFLLADTDFDGLGALVASGSGVPDVADAAALVAYSGAGVGSADTALRTSASAATGVLALSGAGGSGDFQLANDSGDLVIERIPLEVVHAGVLEPVSFRGVHAGGDVEFDNGGRDVVLGEIQADLPDEPVQLFAAAPSLGVSGATSESALRFGFGGTAVPLADLVAAVPDTTTPHVISGGDQRYAGSVFLANPRSFEAVEIDPDTGDVTTQVVDLHEVRLEAGGEVEFEGNVDTLAPLTLADPGSLEVDAAGDTIFHGSVGTGLGAVASVDTLVVGDVRFPAGGHAVSVASAEFRGRIDGPGNVGIQGLDPAGSVLAFSGDIGGRESLAAFAADADLLQFDSDANRIVADDVLLNALTPSAAVPDFATIADSGGGLAIESASDVTIGPREKLSVAGPLSIRAAGTASVGDLSATAVRVDANRILIQGRAPAPVTLASGASVTDRGVDWVANRIATNVIPEWDGVGAPPTFVLGNGGVQVGPGGGLLPFDTIRFTPGVDAVELASFFTADGRQVDLTGRGSRVVSDARDDLPRQGPPVRPGLAARFTDTEPSPPPATSGEEVLRAVRCRTPDGGPCAPPASDGPLASERTREIVQRYHELVASPLGRQRLTAAFGPVAGADLARGPEGGLDGSALYRALASRPELADARERLDELATVLAQVTLLGLDEGATEQVRRAVSRDFAAAAGVRDLDADAVLAAASASGVGALP